MKENLPVSDRWLHIFREMREIHLDFQDFCNVVGFILCLPGSTAPVEGISSVMSSMWTKEKSRLSVETTKAMLIVRQNNDYGMRLILSQSLKKCEYAAKDRFIRKI